MWYMIPRKKLLPMFKGNSDGRAAVENQTETGVRVNFP